MLTFFEKFLFEKFRGMPKWVRVLSYLVMLLLFVYLMLMPRFINGQLVSRDTETGGYLPYRGVEMLMQVEGRDYKFTSNESGYWSIPIVSRLPTTLEVQVFHQDKGLWFPVRFDAGSLWGSADHRIEVKADKPYMVLVRAAPPAPASARRLLAGLIDALVPDAAGQLQIRPGAGTRPPASAAALPPAGHGTAMAPASPATRPAAADAATAPAGVREKVFTAIGSATGKPPAAVTAGFPLKGAEAPSYVQRIKIVMNVEKAYDFKIPDEHWKAMATAGDLADYVAKRETLLELNPALRKNPNASWPQIQQSLPPEQRPVFRR